MNVIDMITKVEKSPKDLSDVIALGMIHHRFKVGEKLRAMNSVTYDKSRVSLGDVVTYRGIDPHDERRVIVAMPSSGSSTELISFEPNTLLDNFESAF